MADTTKRDPRVLPLPGDTIGDASILPLPRPGEHSATVPEPPPRPAPAPRRRIGKYEVERELARGGMGIVYIARSLRLERRVALKVLQAGALADAEEVERFLVEARAAARLRHPNIVNIHEADRDGATWFLAMDLIEGESLRGRVLREGPLPLRQAAALTRDVARALHYAHERGVVHRDVKPHNVLLDAQGAPYVTDFGLAKEVGREGTGLTVTGQVLGTPAYMPPEQALGDLARVDRRSDVYSLGATLYELLTGRPPFTGASAVAILRGVVEDDPTPPSRLRPEVDRDLETIVLTCLAKESARRYDTCALLAEDLERWASDEPIRARRPGAVERATRWARRRPAVVTGAALVPLLVGAVAAVSVTAARRAAARVEVERARAAVEEARGALEREPDVEARVLRAQALVDAARRWSALEDVEAARAARSQAAFTLGDLARSHGDWTRARDAYAEALEVGLEPERAARAVAWCQHMADARAADALDQPFRAIAALDSAVATGVGWSDALLQRANMRFAVGHRTAAIADLDALLRAEPDHVRARVTRAVHRLPIEVDEALADLDHVLTLRPDAPEVLSLRGQLQRRTERLEGALADLRRALALAPTWGELSVESGEVLLMLGRLEEAAEALERGIRLVPDSAAANVALADCYSRMGDPRTTAVAARARELLPQAPAPRLLLAQARLRIEGDLDGAARELDELLRRFPAHPDGLALRAEVRLVAGDPEGARAEADRALEVDPRSALALVVRAQAFMRLGDPGRARADAARATQVDPARPDGWLVLASIERRLGAVEAALEASRRAAAAGPSSPRIRGGAGMLQLDLGRLEEAVTNLDAAVRLGARDALVARGVARFRLGQLGPALEDAEAGLKDGDVMGLLLRALVREQQGDLAEARADAQEFLRQAGEVEEAEAARALLRRTSGR